MDEKKIEQELRSFFFDEVKEIEPSLHWWNNAVNKATEVTSFWEHISGMFSKPILRAALPIAVVLVVIGALWATGVLPGLQSSKTPVSTGLVTPAPTAPKPITPPTTTTPPPRSLKVTAVTDKPSYLPGEKVELAFSLTNITQDPLTLSNFPPYTEVTHKGILVRTFESGGHEIKLEPGETTTYNLTWDQLDSEGDFVSPASYEIAAEYITITKGSPLSTTQESYHEIATVVIEFPQGAMEKTIELSQSQTVNGITITLERVELSATEMKVYILKTPGYTSPPNVVEPPSRTDIADIRGTYKVDDGATLSTFSWGYQTLGDGDKIVWEGLYPVPSDAQTLFFTITRLSIADKGDFGPWEFKVPLQ
jgi:hypothetical protein